MSLSGYDKSLKFLVTMSWRRSLFPGGLWPILSGRTNLRALRPSALSFPSDTHHQRHTQAHWPKTRIKSSRAFLTVFLLDVPKEDWVTIKAKHLYLPSLSTKQSNPSTELLSCIAGNTTLWYLAVPTWVQRGRVSSSVARMEHHPTGLALYTLVGSNKAEPSAICSELSMNRQMRTHSCLGEADIGRMTVAVRTSCVF